MISYRINRNTGFVFVKTPCVVFSEVVEPATLEQVLSIRERYENGELTEKDAENEIILLLFPEVTTVVKAQQLIRELVNLPEFEVVNNKVYLKGVPLSIPQKILEQMYIAYNSDNPSDMRRWSNFWKWLAMNPSEESRSHLYDTMVENDIQILECGLLLMYRRVVKLEGKDVELLEWASKTYTEIRRKKKSTNVSVYKDDTGYNLTGGELIGMLPKLRDTQFEDEELYYTDNYSRTCKFYIGKEARMPRDKVDSNRSQSCSTGYHVGARGFAYSGFGDTSVACVVNPMDIVAVMKNEQGKTRTAAFTPIAILNGDAEWKDEVDIDSLVDIVYEEQVARLNELLAVTNIQDETNGLQTEFNMSMRDIDTIQLFSI